MKNKSNRLLYTLEVLLGVILMGGVFLIAVHVDVRSAKRTLTSTVSYIKEQCNQYERLNLASETKSMMRIIESAHQIDHALTENGTDAGAVTTEMLEQWARDSYVTGVLLLDENGKVQVQYGDPVDGLSTEELSEHMTSDALQDAILFSEKTYAMRFHCEDGSYADLAATGNADGSGMVVAYYHTTLEYTRAFHLSVDTLLVGYNLEQDGTIVVSSGKEIIASNNETLIGKSTDDVEILRKIKEAAASDKLIHARGDTAALSHNYGLMEHGRDYYVYAYLPESDVFDSTIPSVMFSIIVYVIILAIIHMVRWKMAQNYREKQLSIQRQYNEQLQSKNEQLKQAVDQADRANVAKTSFLSRMSHDIRTPMNAIIGFSNLLEKNLQNGEKAKEYLKKIQSSSTLMMTIINQVLEMARIESGTATLRLKAEDLSAIFHDVSSVFESDIRKKNLQYSIDANVCHKYAICDKTKLQEIYLNIVSNAVKYTTSGQSIHVTVKEIASDDKMAQYCFICEDTGIGMSEEYLPHIFEEFSREHTSTENKVVGTGLGLPIVKSLVELMGGSIRAESRQGVGTRFTVTVSLETASKEDVYKEQEKQLDMANIRGKRILLAEDNELNAEIAIELLQEEGLLVELATDGQECFDMLDQAEEGYYDLILMDIQMPNVNGYEATVKIRQMENDKKAQIPIVAMTANVFAEDRKLALDLGMNGHISKPIDMKKVRKVLYNILNAE